MDENDDTSRRFTLFLIWRDKNRVYSYFVKPPYPAFRRSPLQCSPSKVGSLNISNLRYTPAGLRCSLDTANCKHLLLPPGR